MTLLGCGTPAGSGCGDGVEPKAHQSVDQSLRQRLAVSSPAELHYGWTVCLKPNRGELEYPDFENEAAQAELGEPQR